uniref:Uncharacterized protein n=1 Tax=viral metagenome TaxID=1070528 RepID=A0A6C0DG86_9ZZZZ
MEMEPIKIKINIENKQDKNHVLSIENDKFHKMVFLYNALNDGWKIKKKNDSYIFTKNHEGKKEILHDSYLLTFMKLNMDINKCVS